MNACGIFSLSPESQRLSWESEECRAPRCWLLTGRDLNSESATF